MADVLIVWCLVVACTVGVGAGILSAKGLYCRDPDTGKLYPVNTTWPSTTFCGSYTCRLRKRNATEDVLQPFIQVNITKNENSEVIDWPIYDNGTTSVSVNSDFEVTSPENETKGDIDKLIINEEVRNVVKEKNKDIDFTGGKKDEDRYLTEDEIKTLIELLHEVRKSDLEAIVEMYNLAQDVYKEIDTETDGNLFEETIKNIKENENNRKHGRISGNYNEKNTYFYEPLSLSNKYRTDDKTEVYESNRIVDKDMTVEDSNISPVTLSAPNYNQMNSNSYSQGPLTNEDFSKMPYYYYPTSSFQRQNSYHHPNYAVPNITPQTYVHQSGIPQYPAPRNYDSHRNPPIQNIPQYGSPQPYTQYTVQSIPQYHTPQYNIPQNTIRTSVAYEYKPICPHTYTGKPHLLPEQTWFNRVPKKPFNLEKVLEYLPVESSASNRPVAHLPYPFSYQQNYNVTYPNTPNEKAWTLLNLYQNPYQNQHTYSAAYIGHIPNAVIVDPVPERKDIEEKPKVKILENELKLPDWQTAPLSKSVLDEVKANIASKSKLFPLSLRKKIKLEKVGKVIKLDELTRSKREVNNEEKTENTTEAFEKYEVYLEKSTCSSDTEPGFFSMGNETDAYPACCPQRISKPQITETQR